MTDTTANKGIPREELGLATFNMTRESLQRAGRAEGRTLAFTELEREAMLIAQVVACEVVERQFEKATASILSESAQAMGTIGKSLVATAKKATNNREALEALAEEIGKALGLLRRRVEALEAAQR